MNDNWEVWITHPSPDPEVTGPCRVTVLSRLDDEIGPTEPPMAHPIRHRRYRSHCLGCGHQGPPRSDENEAVEDGCDHAFPGWRDMPVLEYRPYQITSADKKKLDRWEADARAAYPPGWFDRAGPVREYRDPLGTRHVPGLAPGGGYCMAVVRHTPQPTAASTAAPMSQTALF